MENKFEESEIVPVLVPAVHEVQLVSGSLSTYKFFELICTPIGKNENVDPPFKNVYLADPPFTDEMRLEIDDLLTRVTIFDSAETLCGCMDCDAPIYHSIYSAMQFARIRIDVFNYLIQKSHFNLSTDEHRNFFLDIFSALLRFGGAENVIGMSYRIEKLAEQMWNWLSREIPHELFSYRDKENHNVGLIGSILCGHNYEFIENYMHRFLDFYEKLYPNREEKLEMFQEIHSDHEKETASKCNLKYALGFSLINAVARLRQKNLLSRLIKLMPEALNCFTSRRNGSDYNDKTLCFETIIPSILENERTTKNQDFLKIIANNFEILLAAGIDYATPIVHSNGNQQSITDYLHHYEYIYPGSPIMEVLSKYPLPDRLDPEGKLFVETENFSAKKKPEQMYKEIKRKYYFTKDPAIFPVIAEEMRAVYVQTNMWPEYFPSGWHVSPIAEFLKEMKQAEHNSYSNWNKFNQQNNEDDLSESSDDE